MAESHDNNDFAELYPAYPANRAADEAAKTRTMVEALSPREAALVREAIVLGYFAGVLASDGRPSPYPKDSSVVETVFGYARIYSDQYPNLARLTEK